MGTHTTRPGKADHGCAKRRRLQLWSQAFKDAIPSLDGRVWTPDEGTRPLDMVLAVTDHGRRVHAGPASYIAHSGHSTAGHMDPLPAVNVILAAKPVAAAGPVG